MRSLPVIYKVRDVYGAEPRGAVVAGDRIVASEDADGRTAAPSSAAAATAGSARQKEGENEKRKHRAPFPIFQFETQEQDGEEGNARQCDEDDSSPGKPAQGREGNCGISLGAVRGAFDARLRIRSLDHIVENARGRRIGR